MKQGDIQRPYNEILSIGNDLFSTAMDIVSHIENNEYEIIAVRSIANVFVPGESSRYTKHTAGTFAAQVKPSP